MTIHAANRINRIARTISAQSYLEVGVATGDTFLRVEIPYKVAVDPHFQFDTSAYETEKQKFYQITSDQFFLSVDDREFDIIFLDGLHTFEQTFRDFCNSILVSTPKTVWIIDDTIPSDVFSSIPSPKEALEYRAEQGLAKHTAWHGDIYKMIFAIHDFFPRLSFRTARQGNPQTVVWQHPRSSFRPIFNDLEKISRLSYFDFRQYGSTVGMADDDEIIAEIQSVV